MGSFLLSISFWILYLGRNIHDFKHPKQPGNNAIIVLATIVLAFHKISLSQQFWKIYTARGIACVLL
jgi:hypothetical protein